MLLFSGLANGLAPGWLGGWPPYPTIDPNIAFTSQALGHRAALDLFAGTMPWWNPFEGVGAPLAGEMQSAALFPLTLLLALPNGQLYEHIALQIIAGLSTYALLRRLDVGRVPALGAATVFAFNGVFAWLGNAAVNPVPFLPMLLFGIETVAARVRAGRVGGGVWIAAALALSLYGGFPEVAYLNGLLAAAWTLLRAATLGGARAGAFLVGVVAPALAGLLIAAPILIAFLDYLPLAELGMHDGSGAAYAHLDPRYLGLIALPYLLGGIASEPEHAAFWSNTGGYGACVLLMLAAAGVMQARHLALRLLLAAWTALSIALSFGTPGLGWLVAAVPGLGQTAFYRYLPASWILCLCILAGFALDDLCRDRARRRCAVGGLAILAALAVALHGLGVPLANLFRGAFARDTSGAAAGFVMLLAGLLMVPKLSGATRAAAMAVLLATESVTWFVLPTLVYPRHAPLDLGAVRFLDGNLGLQRFATLGPIAPNYGSWFAIAAINHNDLPIPRAWVDYVHHHLDANAHPILFNGEVRADPSGPSAADAFQQNQAAYAAIGVRYLVAPAGKSVAGMPMVFQGATSHVYEVPEAAPYFTAAGCTLSVHSRVSVSATCETASRLVRLELAMPGWRARIGGVASEIAVSGEIFQSVALPPGRSQVAFAFEPPHMSWGYVGFGLGIAWLLLIPWPDRRGLPGCRREGAGASSAS